MLGWFVLFLGVVLGVTQPLAEPTPSNYLCPGRPCDCIWLKESGEVVINCAWPYLQPYQDKEYFYSIPAEGTVYMTITCESPGQLSQLWNNMFRHLKDLKQLTITDCAFTDIPPYVFSGLTSLHKLVITGASLSNIHPHFLDGVENLRFLAIVDSRLIHMPSICHLQHLRQLNLSMNAISSFQHAGIICERKRLSNLNQLDVHRNNITILPRSLGSSFPKLKRLSIGDNRITKIETDAINLLPDLVWLDLTNNSLSEVSHDFVTNCTEILVFGLSNNPLNGLPKGVLSSLRNVLQLDLTSINLNDSVWNEIRMLPQLDTLNLADNRLTRIDQEAMQELPLLAFLNVSHNFVKRIYKSTFKKQEKMFHLDLSYNELITIPRQAFWNVYSLKTLDISNNKLASVGRESFQDLIHLQYLDLSFNRLSGLSRSILSDMQSLLSVNLSHNNLRKLPNFEYVSSLEHLDLSDNRIILLNSSVFEGLQELKSLSLAGNRLHTLPAYVFEEMNKLEVLNLANNYLSNVTQNMFRGLSSLFELNLEDNRIYGTTMAFSELHDVQSLHLRGNRLEQIFRGQFPDSLEILDLSFNNLNYISHSTFRTMLYLKEVVLTQNNISFLPSIAVELPRDIKPTAKMYIGGNPLQCDCELGWLKDLNEGQHTDYGLSLPVFEDYRYTTCTSVYEKHNTLLPRVPRSDFLCTYVDKCTRNCPCCGFDACHCRFVCPERCTCVMGDTHYPINRIHCEDRNLTTVPLDLPAGATELLLGDNNIGSVTQHTFLGLSDLLILHLNNSNVHYIADRAFIGLRSLQHLYLNDNYLATITTDTFVGLSNLTHLYLSNNRLRSFDVGAMTPLSSLVFMDIQYNEFSRFNLTDLLPVLDHSSVALAYNPWSCEQTFVCEFRRMLMRYSRSISDAAHVRCILEGDVQFSDDSVAVEFLAYSEQYLCESNSTFFVNVSFDSVVKIGDRSQFSLLVALSLVACVMVVLVLLFFCKKDLLQVWCYSKFGWRVFTKDPALDDANRYYDAFVSCSDKDSHFIVHELLPKLENGNKHFKMCVHFRDFPVGAPKVEAIEQSVKCSKRTIVVLSDSFLDDEWCRFSFTTAHQQVLSEMKNRLVVIVMHDLEHRRLDPQTKLYMNTRTYLEYKDPWFWEKLVYAMPDTKEVPVDLKGAYAVNNVIRMPQTEHPGRYNRGVSIISDTLSNDNYEVPVSSTLYQSVGSGHHTDSSNYNNSQYHYNSSGHYEEVNPVPARPFEERVAPPLPKPRAVRDTFYDLT